MKKIVFLLCILFTLLNSGQKNKKMSYYSTYVDQNYNSSYPIFTNDDNCKQVAFFENYKRMTENRYGNCFYIATAMYMIYLDTFVDGRFVPENYIMKSSSTLSYVAKYSPCTYPLIYDDYVVSDLDQLQEDKKAEEYDRFLEHYSLYLNKCLDLKLQKDIDSKFYVTDYEAFDYFKSCISKFKSVDVKNIENGLSKSISLEFIKNKIKAGFPMLLFVSSTKINKGHVALAYGVDSNDNIICNMGWGENNTKVDILNTKFLSSDGLSYFYDKIEGYLYYNVKEYNNEALSFNYMYEYNNINGYTQYLYHDFIGNYDTHDHIGYKVKSTDRFNHSCECICGENFHGSHVKESNSNYCSICGHDIIKDGGAIIAWIKDEDED